MRIASVAEKFGVTIDTLRYYERIGLIPPVRRQRGIRDYSEEDLGWIEFMTCMRAAGLSIDSLIHYVALVREGDQTRSERKGLLVKQRDALSCRIADLQKTFERLNAKIVRYDETMAVREKKLR